VFIYSRCFESGKRINPFFLPLFISPRLKLSILAFCLFSFGTSAVAAVAAPVAAAPAVIDQAIVIASLKEVLPFFMLALFSGFVAGFAPAMLVKFLREILK